MYAAVVPGSRVLVCFIGGRRCALPLGAVIETMRPLPIEVLHGSVPGVLGMTSIRGEVTPVLDLAALFGGQVTDPTRYVTVRAGTRTVALVVDEIVGIRDLPQGSAAALPPLLADAAADRVAAIARADSDLMIVLNASRLAPEALP